MTAKILGLSSDQAQAIAATSARLFARPEQAVQILSISRRTLSDWQKNRIIPWFRVGGIVLFKITDLERALEKFRVAPVGELKLRKRRAGRIQSVKS